MITVSIIKLSYICMYTSVKEKSLRPDLGGKGVGGREGGRGAVLHLG